MYWIRRIFSKVVHIYYGFISLRHSESGRIYMLHNVGGTEDGPFNISAMDLEAFLMRKKVENFVRLESWTKQSGFRALSIDDVPEGFYHNGFPLLKKYNIPFTIFVATGLLDTDGYITTDQLKEMSNSNLCTIGSHGISHGEYCKLSASERKKELYESRMKLEQITGKSIELYAFPYGSIYACGIRHKKEVMKYYKYGFGTIQSPVTEPLSLPYYYLPRINVSNNNINTI